MNLYTDFSWLINWPKWLDTPFMHWINKGWRGFIADYGLIFDAIGYGLLRGYTELKGIIVHDSLAGCYTRCNCYNLLY